MTDTAVVACKYAPNAVTVRWGPITTVGPLEVSDVQGADSSGLLVRERRATLRLPFAHVSGIARGDTITTTKAGVTTTYRVREVALADDGDVVDVDVARTT